MGEPWGVNHGDGSRGLSVSWKRIVRGNSCCLTQSAVPLSPHKKTATAWSYIGIKIIYRQIIGLI